MVAAPAKEGEKEKSIILYGSKFVKEKNPSKTWEHRDLGTRRNACLVIKQSNDGPKIYNTFFNRPQDICLQQAATAIVGSCLYVLGGRGSSGRISNRIHRLDTLNPADGWKTLDHSLPFNYDSAAVEVMGNLILLFPNSHPFTPLYQNHPDNQNLQNLWGYAYDTVKGNGYPIPPPTKELFRSVVEHCGGVWKRREVIVPTATNVYAYDTVVQSWWLRGRYGPFQGFKGHSTSSNGFIYRFDPDSYLNSWGLHVFDADEHHLLHMQLPEFDFMSKYSGTMFLVPLDDSKLCFLWPKKFSVIGKTSLYYCKIKLSFDLSPSATILEQKSFEFQDIWDVVNCLPIDSIPDSAVEEIKPLSKIDLFDNKVRVEKVTVGRLVYPGLNYLRIGEKHLPTRAYSFSTSAYNQISVPSSSYRNHSSEPFIPSEYFLSNYKGYLVRGKHLLQKLKK